MYIYQENVPPSMHNVYHVCYQVLQATLKHLVTDKSEATAALRGRMAVVDTAMGNGYMKDSFHTLRVSVANAAQVLPEV